MHQPTLATPTSRRRRIGAIATVAAAIAGAGIAIGTNASFQDQAVLTNNTFEAGVFDLTAIQSGGTLAVGPMIPGDVKSFTVVVGNGGNVALDYSASASMDSIPGRGTVNFGSILSMDVLDGASTPAVLYAGTPGSLATQKVLFGDVAPGKQATDRTLAPGMTETLTFKVTFPASSTVQGAATSLKFQFDAAQQKN
jgi:predicted ribosomally synthesized peptide with SipW-like signal peptide